MKRKRRALAVVFLSVAAVLACFWWPKSERQSTRVIIAGSTCMGKMLDALCEDYNETHNGWVQPQLGGTELGLLALRRGVCDIASCSRALTPKEAAGIDSRLVALDAIAVAVHPSNPIANISLQTLKDIYSGKVTDWAQLDGVRGPIVVIGREAGSGTRSAFEAAIGLTEPAVHSQEHSETGMLRIALATAPGAIGYLSFDYVDESIKQISVNGVMPCEESVRLGTYPISRGFWLCTLAGESRGQVLEFLDYTTGETGRRVIESLGMLPAEPVTEARL
ncbi:phosphate ABC transporter substrate-binding protein [Oscillospiraceae bacterium LTW-04]|nr:phosphate ABC transporter substrate-binding protein [Oscillospiraceae bacterium MB24-C1]